uniref:Galectin n=1 Tax=Oryctolagus cuniculus TaxID=9986 RepID=A0A5F9C5W9_RABIT
MGVGAPVYGQGQQFCPSRQTPPIPGLPPPPLWPRPQLEGTSSMPIPQRAPTMSLSCSFVINLGQGTDKLGLHFNPRFKESTIVCNSRDGSQWGREQRENHLCFSPGSEVKLTMTFEGDKFKVKLPDGHELTFPNRLGHSHLSYLGVQGGFSISSFKFE